ncbi:hypothetical protein BDZ91DRAFT_761338 [Kalaharituber pfeilii]|nr:hypothetical protein BDZ91DRAFT_761338 [Kalaharituber pfeilii]
MSSIVFWTLVWYILGFLPSLFHALITRQRLPCVPSYSAVPMSVLEILSSVTASHFLKLKVNIGKTKIVAFVDSGAAVSLVAKSLVRRLKVEVRPCSTSKTEGKKKEKRLNKVNKVEFYMVLNWKAHENLKFIAQDRQWTLHKFHDIIQHSIKDGLKKKLEHAIEEAVARGEVRDGEDYTVTEKEISMQDIERGDVDTQQIIDFIKKSKALDDRKPEDQIYETIVVKDRKRDIKQTIPRTSGSRQTTVEEEDSDRESMTSEATVSPETPQKMWERGDSWGYTQPTGIRPPTPDRPKTPDVDDQEHEEGFLIDTCNGAVRQARSWVEKMEAGRVKPETARYMGASTAEALQRMAEEYWGWKENQTRKGGHMVEEEAGNDLGAIVQAVERLKSIEDRVVVIPEWPEELIRAEEEAKRGKQTREGEEGGGSVREKGKGREMEQEASGRVERSEEEREELPKKKRRSPQLEEKRKDKMRTEEQQRYWERRWRERDAPPLPQDTPASTAPLEHQEVPERTQTTPTRTQTTPATRKAPEDALTKNTPPKNAAPENAPTGPKNAVSRGPNTYAKVAAEISGRQTAPVPRGPKTYAKVAAEIGGRQTAPANDTLKDTTPKGQKTGHSRKESEEEGRAGQPMENEGPVAGAAAWCSELARELHQPKRSKQGT